MIQEIIPNKVYYKIFDKSYTKSTGCYSEKNANPDKLAEIQQNFLSIAGEFNAYKIVTLNQVHGNDVLLIDNDFDHTKEYSADAMVTKIPNIVLAIKTADCCPVILYCEKGEVIAAAHLGWKSSKLDLVKNVVQKMRDLGVKNICSIIGPTIMQKSYEVDSNYYQSFLNDGTHYKQFFISSIKAGYYMFDLVSFVKYKLETENVKVLHHIQEDTYSNPDKYFSYRRCFHTGVKYNGNILSTIMIKDFFV